MVGKGLSLSREASQKNIFPNRRLQLLARDAEAQCFIEDLPSHVLRQRRPSEQLPHLGRFGPVYFVGEVIKDFGFRPRDYFPDVLPAERGVRSERLADYLQPGHPSLSPPEHLVYRLIYRVGVAQNALE